MPKAKDKTNKRQHEGDNEDWEEESQMSQKRGARGRKTQEEREEKLSGDELKRKVSEMVRFMLFADKKKFPIKRGDLTKQVLKEHSRAFNQVFELTKQQMKKVFGIDVEEIGEKTKSYLLIDAMEHEGQQELIHWGDDLPKMGFLMVILSIIFMSDNVISEALLWHTLKKLGVEPKVDHDVFGDPEKLITQEFVRQTYLERRKIVGGEETQYEYHWGPRAQKELTKRKVLEFVAEMYGNEVDSWTAQMKEVLAEEGQGSDTVER